MKSLRALLIGFGMCSVAMSSCTPDKRTSETNYTEEVAITQSPTEEYANSQSPTETSTDLEPWMIGTWKGSTTISDNYGNSFKMYWALEIDKYGNTTQIVSSTLGSEIETFTLKYDRQEQHLYYKQGGLNVTFEVDSKSKQIYMPSDYGTLYFYKQ